MSGTHVCRKLGTASAVCISVMLGVQALAGMFQTASAAQGDSIITAPEALQVNAGATQPLPLGIAPGGEVPKNSMLLISGLPSTSSLSAGRLFASGTWALRLADLEGLRIETTPAASGRMQLTLSVVTLDGRSVAERTLDVAFVPPGGGPSQPPGRNAPGGGDVTPTAAPPAPTLAEQKPEVRALMSQGDNNLASGKVQVARLFYRRAAEQGYAPGALAMAHTFDPGELAKMTVVGGVQPDVAQARDWYEKAKALGSLEAERGLSRLTQR